MKSQRHTVLRGCNHAILAEKEVAEAVHEALHLGVQLGQAGESLGANALVVVERNVRHAVA